MIIYYIGVHEKYYESFCYVYSIFMDILINFVEILREILIGLLFVRVIMSWFGWRNNFIFDITDYILKPVQKVVPTVGGVIDFSPMVAYLLIELSAQVVIYFLTKNYV